LAGLSRAAALVLAAVLGAPVFAITPGVGSEPRTEAESTLVAALEQARRATALSQVETLEKAAAALPGTREGGLLRLEAGLRLVDLIGGAVRHTVAPMWLLGRDTLDEDVAEAVAQAIKACLVLEIDYKARTDPAPRRRAVTPFGLLAGARRYLVARPEDDPDVPVRTYRLDSVASASLTARGFERPADFDLQAFSQRAFGLFQNDREFGEVIWRFAPRAAEQAAGYLFHPRQRVAREPDGSLTVRFEAAGHLEMAWHLYAWGDAVEVLKPARLRKLVAGHRRGDFEGLP